MGCLDRVLSAFQQLIPDQMILFLSASALVACYATWKLVIGPEHFSKLPNVPGPPSDSWLFGSQLKVVSDVCSVWHLRWFAQYGSVFKYRTFGGEEALAVIDPKAVQHILLHQAKHFPKPADEIRTVGLATGPGLLVVEGEDHRRQRKILSPAFTQAQVMSYFPVFTDQAKNLVAHLENISEANSSSKHPNSKGPTRINISDWLTRTTMDIIGSAGFGYNIQALDDPAHPLVDAFARMLTPLKMNAILFLGLQFIANFTWIAKIPVPIPGVQLAQRSLFLMKQCAREMLDSKEEELALGHLDDEKDILSCIIKANKLAVLEKDRLTDEELVSTVATTLLLGHETSAGGLAWLLHELSLHPEIQEHVRREVKEAYDIAALVDRDDLTYEEVDGLEYLDAVLREGLRLRPPLPMTLRRSTTYEVLPLQTPITGFNGDLMTEIAIPSGQVVVIDITAFNRQVDMFGDNPDDFRPERWLGEEGLSMSGNKSYLTYCPLTSFLGGNRGCIAAKFAIMEMKAILVQLIKTFEFQATGDIIEARWHVAARPVIKDRMCEGAQLPINIRKVEP